MTRFRYAVITTHERREDFADCVRAIAPQVDVVIAVQHNSTYAGVILDELGRDQWAVCQYVTEVPNISEMWNRGLRLAGDYAQETPYDVAVLNDDAIVPDDWFQRVTNAMRAQGAAAGCVKRKQDPRMSGYAFILASEAELYADEQFQWWYGDDDLQRRAELEGGVAFALGADVEHRHPNSTTVGVLADVAQQDRRRFSRKWTP